jgi:hypothetical protein
MRDAKVWTRDAAGKKHHRVLLDDGRQEHLEFLEGLTAQQSLVALQQALEVNLGDECRITIMDKLTVFDERDGLNEAARRHLGETLRQCPIAETEH